MADWPQWRGIHRNGISAETGWKSQFGASGPRKLWQARIGEGFSSVAVKGNSLYTIGNLDGKDYVTCFNASTGKAVWQQTYAQGAGDYGGPRATATIHNGRIYTMSREGVAFCWDAASSKLLWRREAARENGAQSPQWGFAGSPLIQGNLAIYNIGASGTALDKNTGRVVWKSGGTAGYSSPVAFTVGGMSGVALFVASGLVAVNATTGRVLFQHPWNTSYDVNAADPVFVGDTVFLSSNYGKGGALLRIAGGKPSVIWENRSMKNHFNTSVVVNGGLFGNDENTLRCLDFATGAERWSMRGMDKGGLIASDNKLIALTGRGELVIAQATPTRFQEISRAKVLDGTCWTHPVLANGLLYCRSQEGVLICLDVRGKA